MKAYLEVQKDRIKYHTQPFKNTVHRSSLTAPCLLKTKTWISFINHFLLKRKYSKIMKILKILLLKTKSMNTKKQCIIIR